MQQHTETADHAVPAFACVAQKFRLQRDINRIRHHGAGLEAIERKIQWRLTRHPERRGVNKQIDDGERP